MNFLVFDKRSDLSLISSSITTVLSQNYCNDDDGDDVKTKQEQEQEEK